MSKFTKLAIATAGAALALQGAFAANNDLILSINNNSGSPAGSTEFTVNLGQLSSFTAPNYDLSSFMSTFNSSFTSAGASGLNVGVVGGQNGQGGFGNAGVGNDVFTTTLRTGGGSYTSAGSSAPGSAPSSSFIANAGGIAGGFTGFGPNNAISDSTSFSSLIAKDPTTAGTAANSFIGYLGTADDPLHTMTGSTITLDLWKDTQTSSGGATSGWTYQGTLTFDTSGAQPSLTFDAAPVPEPSIASLFVGAGVLSFLLRRKLRLGNA